MSVIMHAPAVFRFTAPSNPERHLHAARLMGASVSGAGLEDAGDVLAESIIKLMRATGMPNGLRAVGYTEADLDTLVQGALPQHRVIKLSPRPVGAAELRQLYQDSLTIW
jgi:hydroxyacid-oxoacid transhydrogenase